MAFNPQRNDILKEVRSILGARRSAWNRGKTSGHLRTHGNNAWSRVSMNGLSLPVNSDTFAKTYARGQKVPAPSLTSITISTTGELGHAIHVEVSFTCYSRSDFELFDKKWLRPGNVGKISFGFVKPWAGTGQTNVTLENLHVAYFDFNTDGNGYYICRMKMVGPSRFLETMDVRAGLKDSGKLKYKVYSALNIGSGMLHDVNSIEELLLYDAQKNGMDSTSDPIDNTHISTPYGDILIYDPIGSFGGFMRGARRAISQVIHAGEKNYTYTSEYYSLEYIVNRIVNDQLLGYLKTVTDDRSAEILSKMKIRCNSEVTVGASYPEVRSADPLSVLMLGGGKGRYKNDSNGHGKDFENDGKGQGKNIKCWKPNEVDLSKIMIERMAIISAIENSRGKSESQDASAMTVPTQNSGVFVYVKHFLDEIFKTISYATGDLYQLALVEDPDDYNILNVVDLNNGQSQLINVFVFDILDGNSDCIDVTMTSKAGSLEYRAAMFSSIIKPSDINTILRDKVAEVNAKRAKKRKEAEEEIKKKVNVTLPDGDFGPDEVEGLRQLLKVYNSTQSVDVNKQKQVILYPGMSMNVKMDGIWGWRVGNHISTTLCPKDPYRIESKGIAFNVQKVVHTIQDNTWITTLDAIMSFAGPVKYI